MRLGMILVSHLRTTHFVVAMSSMLSVDADAEDDAEFGVTKTQTQKR